MKRIILVLSILFITIHTKAQNPLSYPKDTLISAPELNFEILWHTFEDNYAFFQLRGIDWKRTYQQYRPLVNATTTNDSLFSIFSLMLAPFQDNHINVIMPGVKQFKSVKPSQFVNEFATDSARNLFWQTVDKNLASKGFGKMETMGPTFNNKPLFSYAVSKKIGYLRFNRCFVDGDAESKPDAAIAGKILDSVMLYFKNVNSLVIDVRDNIGGNDEFSFEVAGRFTKVKRIGMYKETRITGGGYEDFGKLDKWLIEPGGKTSFTKPVVVLTNDKTVSAGDVFAMIMKELPQVKMIGTNTRGIYSDMYGFTLPNKWLISLSNQRYFNNKMTCCEGKGTPVDVEVKNTYADITNATDPVLNEGLQLLMKKQLIKQSKKRIAATGKSSQ